MPNEITSVEERRDCPRIALKGSVTLQTAEHQLDLARIANISAGGLLAETPAPGPHGLAGQPVELQLRLDMRGSEWLPLHGRICRVDAHAVAVAFDQVPPTFQRMLDEMVPASRAHGRVLHVVLIDESAERRQSIAQAFRAAGCNVLDTSSPLESIVRLGELAFEPDIIAIADSIPSSTSEQLREFVERHHPAAKLVTISEADPHSLAYWLSWADPDLAAHIHDVLAGPAHRS